ncbi:MAG: DNA topoisomerase, partial [Steroidobacteraceae bacterium]
TMRLAQQLYEGVDYGEGAVGLITYMRTDSVSLAAEAVTEIRATIEQLYGKAGLSDEIRVFKTKSKNAQEAHEAVRPTSAAITPALLEGKIDNDQFRLYSLIWKRAVACQMAHAVFDTVAVDMRAGKAGNAAESHRLRANGSTLVSPGYIAVYQEGKDDAKEDDDDHVLPPMKEGDAVTLVSLIGNQHFTEPPPRFSEASLVKALEEFGIGRPSTYASIISTLKDREYVDMDGRRFIATDIGKIVARFLTTYFTEYVQYGFTADMEDELDAISRGEEPWVTPLQKFWKPFIAQVEKIETTVSRDEVAQARELGMHPELQRPISVRMGRFGAFVQAGTKDDVEKPKFAGLRPGQKMDTITLEQALELFKLPRDVGETADGEKITVAIGRFGPYIKYGAKYVSLKEPDDPYTVTLERCIECIEAKKVLDANRIIQDFGDTGIQVLNGRYGPYITDKERNARIPKDRDPKTLTLEECQALLAAAPVRPMRGRFGRGAKGGKFAKTAAKAKGKAAGAKPAAVADAPAAKAKAKAPAKAKAKAKKKKAKTKRPAAKNAKAAKPAADAATPANGKTAAAD